MKMKTLLLSTLLSSLLFAFAVSGEVVDTIVAIVGDNIILLSELQKQVNSQMMARGLDMNSPREVLIGIRDETLEGMVDDRLLVIKALQDSLEVDEREVDRELKTSLSDLRQRYGTEEAYIQGLEEYGLNEVQLRRMYQQAIRKNFLLDQLRMIMSRTISVTPQDMEQWVEANSDSLPEIPERFKISHILLYPKVSEDRKETVKSKLLDIRNSALNGGDFAKLATDNSEDPGTAKNGGFIDWFTRDSGYDPDFTSASFALKKGEISNIVETMYGLHIIKCEDILGEKVQARHILLRLVANEQDEQSIVDKLNLITKEITDTGVSFEDQAKKYSGDENSREFGGKLNWITSAQGMNDSGIPSFITEARKLEIGGISPPFKSQYGYHIIKLEGLQEPHILNVRDDRTMLENLIRQKKFISEYGKLIMDLRMDTYIDIRLN